MSFYKLGADDFDEENQSIPESVSPEPERKWVQFSIITESYQTERMYCQITFIEHPHINGTRAVLCMDNGDIIHLHEESDYADFTVYMIKYSSNPYFQINRHCVLTSNKIFLPSD